MKKRLYRSTTDRMIAGVIGGLAEYFAIDSALLRLVAALGILATGLFPGVVLYLIAVFIVPNALDVTIHDVS